MNTPQPKLTLSYFLVLVAATFLLGSSFVVGKHLLETIPPLTLVGWRFFLAAFALLPVMLWCDKGFFVRTRDDKALAGKRLWLVVVLTGLLQTTAVMGFIILAMLHIPAPMACILVFTNPIWVALMGTFVLGEPLTRPRILGLAIGIIGVVLAIGPTESHAFMGTLLGLLSSLSWASATILVKRTQPPLSPWGLAFWQMIVGGAVLLVIGYAIGEQWPAHFESTDWLWFSWLVIPATTIAYACWFLALSWGGAVRSSSFLFLAPLFATLLSHLVVGNELHIAQICGGILIGVALWLVNQVTLPGTAKKEAIAKVI